LGASCSGSGGRAAKSTSPPREGSRPSTWLRRPVSRIPTSCKLAEAGILPTDEKVSFVLHLVDPFQEGLRRARELTAALDSLEERFQRLGSDRVYVLAKRIDVLTSRNPALRSCVEKELGAFLRPAQRDTGWAELRAAGAASDLRSRGPLRRWKNA
jgi:hypothetical protein